MVNLLNNALKFNHPHGKIDLSLEKQGNQVKVSIKDNGTGISPDRLTQLFNGETLESQPGINREKGTGLGLLLCKKFVEMHESEIHVNSEEGKGAEFWFMLPFFQVKTIFYLQHRLHQQEGRQLYLCINRLGSWLLY